MDAAGYLKRQGWRGDGHSLDHTGRGIRKPLLVSKKVDVLGVGLNKHAAVSDQWWMRAFDQGLKDLGTGKRSALSDVREKGMSYGGLYGRFVKGEGVPGTFDEKSEGKESRKRKREEGQEDDRKGEKKVKTDITSLQKELNRNVRRFVNEAVQRGLIPKDTEVPPAKSDANSAATRKYGERAVAKVFKQAGLQDGDKSEAGNQDKYARGKLERAVKRAAKEHLLSRMPPEERKLLEHRGDKRKQKDRENQAEKDEDDQKSKAKEVKALKKRERREKKMAEGGEFESNADEIKIGTNSKSKSKTVPGVGAVERYPTKAEKRAKKLQAEKENLTPGEPTKATKPSREPDDTSSGSNDVDFAVDTTGDGGLTGRESSADSWSVIDSDGNIRYTCKPGQEVPLDPTIWTGIKPKLLPKPVRMARTEHMRQKREERQARKAKKGES